MASSSSLLSPPLLIFLLLALASAAPAPEEFLAAHNGERQRVGVAALKWDDTLGKRASLLARYQRNHKGCGFANVTGAEPYGANQLWSSAAVSPSAAVHEWVAQGLFYRHADNSCDAGHQCGVYTQLVWRNTTTLGCGSATCPLEKAALTICLYVPPGNYIGESPY